MDKINLKGLTLHELEAFALSIGEKKFRGKQIYQWLYEKRASSFSDMNTLSKSLRDKLSEIASISFVKIVSEKKSHDGTTKFLFGLSEKHFIESVLIPPRTAFTDPKAKAEVEQQRLTLCLSTQVGCPLDCIFCATGSMGFYRNLSAGEILDQFLQAERSTEKRITNLVFMGMGEPLLNYESVMKSIEIFTTGIAIAARHITVSTVGLVPQIRRIAEEKKKFKLAISLHSLDEKVRSSLMPVAARYKLEELISTIEYYYRLVKRRPTFEYILLRGLNDRAEDLRNLVRLSKRIPCKVNIIPFHNIRFAVGNSSSLSPTPPWQIDEFVKRLREAHVTVFVRSSAGESIEAACGQLAVGSLMKKTGIRLADVKLKNVKGVNIA